jgi:hypothetical protein
MSYIIKFPDVPKEKDGLFDKVFLFRYVGPQPYPEMHRIGHGAYSRDDNGQACFPVKRSCRMFYMVHGKNHEESARKTCEEEVIAVKKQRKGQPERNKTGNAPLADTPDKQQI